MLGEDFVDVGAVAVLLGGGAIELSDDLVVDEEVAGGAFADAIAHSVVAINTIGRSGRIGRICGTNEVVAGVPNEGVAGLGGHLAVAVVAVGFVAGGGRCVHGVESAGFGVAVEGFRGGVANEVEVPATGLSAVVLGIEAVHGVEGGIPGIEGH